MTTLSPYDLHFAVRRLPRVLRDAMKKQGPAIIVAGGFVRACIAGETVNDIDVFAPSKELAEAFAKGLQTKHTRLIETDNAFTLIGHGVPLQFIHRWTYDRPEDVVPSFDFTIARSAFWFNGEKWQSLCDESFYADLAAKRIVYCSPIRNEEAGGSLLRVLKFYQRGYRMPLGSLGLVLGRLLKGIPEEKLNDRKGMSPEEWEQQIGHVLTGLLREVDPLIDPDHIAHESDLPKEDESLEDLAV